MILNDTDFFMFFIITWIANLRKVISFYLCIHFAAYSSTEIQHRKLSTSAGSHRYGALFRFAISRIAINNARPTHFRSNVKPIHPQHTAIRVSNFTVYYYLIALFIFYSCVMVPGSAGSSRFFRGHITRKQPNWGCMWVGFLAKSRMKLRARDVWGCSNIALR